ncbi:MAG: hypothetical protein DI537_37895 [Stutzerimonas stutzeri]|nr:MAG: hypothetical protein DI537_37895 [Stutzerimonas stutzeri]
MGWVQRLKVQQMEIVNFGNFVANSDGGIIYFRNEDNEDWYDLRLGLMTWTSAGTFVDAVYGAWAAVDPVTMRVTNVEFDPSRLMPNNRIILGIDADPADIAVGDLFTGTSLVRVPQPVTVEDVVAERARRLARGFSFDFGDERGIHQIATTDQDLRNWDEVTKLAAAYISISQPAATIAIRTDTGPVTVTAAEWQLVLIATGAFRQPIFQASFVLQAMDPIPADYTDDRHWS